MDFRFVLFTIGAEIQNLYNNVRIIDDVDFNLNVQKINYKNTKIESLKYISCLFSKSESFFYIPIELLITTIFRDNIIYILQTMLIK